ncbi:MAG: DUF6384 family protein [Pseudomonadota bacterium]
MTAESPAIRADGGDADVGLTDVMLAMDVVDTLRHEQRLVQRALDRDARDQALIERVRESYAAQGIEVSEATVRAGVDALRAREFAYEPAPPGFKTKLLHGWVGRGRVARGVGLFAGVGALIAAGYVGFVTLPERAERAGAIEQMNAAISVATVDLATLDRRRISLAAALGQVDDGTVAPEFRDGFERERAAAAAGLESAARGLEAASALTQTAGYDGDTEPARLEAAGRRVEQQRAALSAVAATLDSVDAAIQRLNRLHALPGELALLRDEALALAREDTVDADVRQRHQAAAAALRRGEVAAAEGIADDLKQLIDTLAQVFEVRVVSRPGVASGIIRGPDVNPAANNYYLIVEAIGPDDGLVRVPIRSEEDGSVRTVSRWGIRVERPVFERVRDDKLDDGIIQSNLAGRKRRGFADIEYTVPTSGGTINRWEEPR